MRGSCFCVSGCGDDGSSVERVVSSSLAIEFEIGLLSDFSDWERLLAATASNASETAQNPAITHTMTTTNSTVLMEGESRSHLLIGPAELQFFGQCVPFLMQSIPPSQTY